MHAPTRRRLDASATDIQASIAAGSPARVIRPAAPLSSTAIISVKYSQILVDGCWPFSAMRACQIGRDQQRISYQWSSDLGEKPNRTRTGVPLRDAFIEPSRFGKGLTLLVHQAQYCRGGEWIVEISGRLADVSGVQSCGTGMRSDRYEAE